MKTFNQQRSFTMNITKAPNGVKKRTENWQFILCLIIFMFALLMSKYLGNMQDPDYFGREHSWMLPYWFLSLCCGIWISATYYRSIGYMALGLVFLVQVVAALFHPDTLALVLGFALGGLLWFGMGHLVGRFFRNVGIKTRWNKG